MQPSVQRERLESSKELYEVGEPVPAGIVPRLMHAWVLRRETHGEPAGAFRREIVEVPSLGADEVLVQVMAAGVNYNGVWAALGTPQSPLDLHGDAVHIAGSDAAGIVWAVGSSVKHWAPGDEVVVHCGQADGQDPECNGGDPMLSPSQRIWGYETSYGAFAQFTRVQATQLVERPKHLSWEQSACYMLTLATAYRMLFGHAPHTIGPGKTVLIWGAAGGLGSMAVQLVTQAGGRALGVVSSNEKVDYVKSLGAVGVINRKNFSCWGHPPSTENSKPYDIYLKEVRRFGKEIWQYLGNGSNPDIVFEHCGADTFAVSCYLAKPGGMIVFCAATSGYDLVFDARYAWMRQKRIQGSHFANLKQAHEANRMVVAGSINPCLSATYDWTELPIAHQAMRENKHAPGNMAVSVQARLQSRSVA